MEKSELQIYDAECPMFQFKKYIKVNDKWDEISCIRTNFTSENEYLLRSFIDYIFEVECINYQSNSNNIWISFADKSRLYYYGHNTENFENKYLKNYISIASVNKKI